MDNELSRLLNMINEVSPNIYQAAVRQVYINLVLLITGAIALTVAAGLDYRYVKGLLDRDEFDGDALGHVIALIAGLFLAIGAVVVISSAISYIINFLFNPDWLIIQLILGGS